MTSPYNPFEYARAYSVADFCLRAGLGPTKTYALIGAGDLIARAVGKKTILVNCAQWFDNLPPPPKLGKPAAPRRKKIVA